MDDLITWLRAQLDDDERAAQAVPEGPWEARLDGPGHPDVISDPRDREHGRDEVVLSDVWRDGMTDYVTRFDPRRVLAEVDTKRRILDDCAYEIRDSQHRDTGDGLGLSETVLSLLALPYADRPGYRPEWTE